MLWSCLEEGGQITNLISQHSTGGVNTNNEWTERHSTQCSSVNFKFNNHTGKTPALLSVFVR